MNRNFNSSGPPRGGYSYGSASGGNSDITIQRDTIFVQNLPKNVTTDELSQSFGAIGIIKRDKRTGLPKIWIYKDKSSGEGKGEATVTYDDEAAAEAAINWFNDKEVMGNIVKVSLATRKSNFSFSNGRGGRGGGRGGRGGYGGGGGGGYGGGGGRGGDRDGGYGGGGGRGGRGGYGGGGGGGGYGGDRDGGYGGGGRGGDRDGGYGGRGANDRYSRPAPY